MRKALLILIGLPLILSAGGIRENTEDTLRDILGPGITLTMKKMALPARARKSAEKKVRQRFFKKWLYGWRISRNDSTLAYALLDNVKGKAMPITFLVVFNPDGDIRATRIIKYREAIGGAVQNLSWLRQFSGLTADSSYTVGRKIDGISGATISVHSVTRGIHKLTLVFPALKEVLDEQ